MEELDLTKAQVLCSMCGDKFQYGLACKKCQLCPGCCADLELTERELLNDLRRSMYPMWPTVGR